MGTADPRFPGDGEGPVRTVSLSPFSIAAELVTNDRFATFVQATGHLTAAERDGSSFVFAGYCPIGSSRPSGRARRPPIRPTRSVSTTRPGTSGSGAPTGSTPSSTSMVPEPIRPDRRMASVGRCAAARTSATSRTATATGSAPALRTPPTPPPATSVSWSPADIQIARSTAPGVAVNVIDPGPSSSPSPQTSSASHSMEIVRPR